MAIVNNSAEFLPIIRRNQGVFIACVIFIVIAFLTFQFLIPNIQKIQEVIVTSQDQEKKLTDLRNKVTVLESINKTEEAGILKKIIAVLPEEKDVFSIFAGIDGLESDSGVVITKSDFRVGVISTESAKMARSATGENESLRVLIQFEAVGTRESMRKLFDILGTVKTRLFTASEVHVGYAGQDQMTVNFVLSAYYSPFPASLGSVQGSLPEFSKELMTLKTLIAKESLPVSEVMPSMERGKEDLFSAVGVAEDQGESASSP